MDILLILHDRFAVSVMLFMAAAGFWGLFSYIRGQSLSGSIGGTLVIGEALIILQVVAGLALVIGGARPASPIHYLYGASGILALPFAWSFMRYRDQRQALLIYSLVALFIAGLAIRGMTTA
jgi:hypothetical protein